ncbi:MAG: hypothetical protein NVSMB38_32610 [Ktedonobacteraceae bacterium]
MEKFQLGTFLKEARERQKLSTRELEKRAREKGSDMLVTTSQINKIENGKTNPSFLILQKVAAALDLPLVIILDGSKADVDAVTIVSTSEVVEALPQVLNRADVVELLMYCLQLTDEQVAAILGVARSIRGFTQPTYDDKS